MRLMCINDTNPLRMQSEKLKNSRYYHDPPAGRVLVCLESGGFLFRRVIGVRTAEPPRGVSRDFVRSRAALSSLGPRRAGAPSEMAPSSAPKAERANDNALFTGHFA